MFMKVSVIQQTHTHRLKNIQQLKRKDTSVWSKIIQFCFVFSYLCDVEEKKRIRQHFLAPPSSSKRSPVTQVRLLVSSGSFLSSSFLTNLENKVKKVVHVRRPAQ